MNTYIIANQKYCGAFDMLTQLHCDAYEYKWESDVAFATVDMDQTYAYSKLNK